MGKAGTVNAPSHAQGGKDFIVVDTGQTVNIEGKEIVVPEAAVLDSAEHIFSGTNREVLGQILSKYDLSVNDNVTSVKSGDVVICKVSATDKKKRKFTGTVRQILSAINAAGGCNMISDAADIEILKDGGSIGAAPKRFAVRENENNIYIWDNLFQERVGPVSHGDHGRILLQEYADSENEDFNKGAHDFLDRARVRSGKHSSTKTPEQLFEILDSKIISTEAMESITVGEEKVELKNPRRFIVLGTASTSYHIFDSLYKRQLDSQAWSSTGKQMLQNYAGTLNQHYISDNTFMNPDKKTFEKPLPSESTALATASNFIADVKTHVMN